MPPLNEVISPTGVRIAPACPEQGQFIRAVGAILARHKTSERMADRYERFAADVAAARAASVQASAPAAANVGREAKAERVAP